MCQFSLQKRHSEKIIKYVVVMGRLDATFLVISHPRWLEKGQFLNNRSVQAQKHATDNGTPALL
jgi:hypothetical protein